MKEEIIEIERYLKSNDNKNIILVLSGKQAQIGVYVFFFKG